MKPSRPYTSTACAGPSRMRTTPCRWSTSSFRTGNSTRQCKSSKKSSTRHSSAGKTQSASLLLQDNNANGEADADANAQINCICSPVQVQSQVDLCCVGWRRDWRHDGVRCGVLPARRGLHPGAHDRDGDGGQLRRWEDGREPPPGQKHDWRIPPAGVRHHGPGGARVPSAAGDCVRRERSRQVRADPRRGTLPVAGGCPQRRGHHRGGPGRGGLCGGAELRHQGGHRRRGRARGGREGDAQPRPHLRPRHRDMRRLRELAAR
mmetsp:Transcript_2776/g.6677  ORF Transcript_2776/g.6677 Transcript_2776/m.6677 type:complete len:263 (-) Transcript_2776:2150-2938(-)